MDIRRFEEFSVLARAKSFRQAAGTLGISPALLSSRIQALENKLGVRLLLRDAHHFELTEAGKCFLADARELAGDYQSILSRIASISHHTYRSIRIGMSGFLLPSNLGPYLDTVNLLHPDIHLEIHDDSLFGIASGLNGNSVDVFFSYCLDDLAFEGIEKVLLYSTRMLVLVPKSHRLAYQSVISARELDGERFVLYPQTAEPAMRNCELALLQRTGVSFSIYNESLCPSRYFFMAPIGKGLILCPWVLRDFIPPNTMALTVSEPDFVMSMYMFYRKNSSNPYLPEFLSGFRNFREGGMKR